MTEQERAVKPMHVEDLGNTFTEEEQQIADLLYMYEMGKITKGQLEEIVKTNRKP